MIEINWQPSKKELRVFALLSFAFFGLVGYWTHSGGHSWTSRLLWGLGLLLGLGGLIRPAALLLVYRMWMTLAYPIGFVLSNVLMGAVYYLVITPTGLVMRAFGWDPMSRRIDRSAASCWVPHHPPTSMSKYFRGY